MNVCLGLYAYIRVCRVLSCGVGEKIACYSCVNVRVFEY